MGFYLRKSISVGPLRFNLSKSGVGVSAGVKGFRFGASPRGTFAPSVVINNLNAVGVTAVQLRIRFGKERTYH